MRVPAPCWPPSCPPGWCPAGCPPSSPCPPLSSCRRRCRCPCSPRPAPGRWGHPAASWKLTEKESIYLVFHLKTHTNSLTPWEGKNQVTNRSLLGPEWVGLQSTVHFFKGMCSVVDRDLNWIRIQDLCRFGFVFRTRIPIHIDKLNRIN